MGGSSQRTATERERARAERERRRGRSFAPADSEAPAVEAPAVEAPAVEAPAVAAPPVPIPGPSPEPIPAPAPMPSPPPRVPAFAGVPATARPGGRRWPARLGVGVLLIAILALLGGVLAFVLLHHKSKSKPPVPIAVVTVTIPEGETRAQIAAIAADKGLKGSYLKASRRSALLDPGRYGAPRATSSLEGFLFPATYELYAGAPAARLVAEQLAAFHENFGAAQSRRAHALHISPYQLLIVASMIEREALLARDRPRVAAVIYNRLRIGMPLGIDSTLRYALHDFTKPLTEAQLQLDSPYNTRTHHGLPPTPISNPGDAAIAAAAHPAHVPYLYYVNGADGCGELVFSTSSAQFERDAAAYRQAIAAHGGRVPTCHKR
jgi:cell division protein YceG involved in septum cleavage